MDFIWYIVYAISFLLLIPSFILGYIAQKKTVKIFDKFSKFKSFCNVKVHEFALILYSIAGITDIEIVQFDGKYTNCYDPRNKILRLSESMVDSISLASLGICAHEVGHAVQHNEKMKFYSFRSAIIPVMNFFAKAFIPLIIIGSFLSFTLHLPTIGLYTLWIGNITYAITFVFYLVTFPLEFNASKKAVKLLSDCEFFVEEEKDICQKVIKSTSWKYILNLTSCLLFFINFISYSNLFDRNK